MAIDDTVLCNLFHAAQNLGEAFEGVLSMGRDTEVKRCAVTSSFVATLGL